MLSAWLVISSHAYAETVTGTVVGISDGDTITVLIDRQQVKVRLANIEAPQSRQPFGARSKQALSDLCFEKHARLETQGRDRYGRIVATVHCAGRNANAEQVWQGMAWVFARFASPELPLYILLEQAKAARRGLWSDPNPTPPWEWRAREMNRKGAAPSTVTSPPTTPAQPRTERKWVCERREIPGQPHAAIDCGWR